MPDTEITRAGFGPRAAAFIVDELLLLIALSIVRLPFLVASAFGSGVMTARSFLFDHSALDVLCWVLSRVYLVLMTYLCGATLGKKVMRLRVESEEGDRPRLIDVIYRETVGRFLSSIFCVGYLMALADRKKRAFHDYLCDTRVVYDGVRLRGPAPASSEALSADSTPRIEWSVPGGERERPREQEPASAEALPGDNVPRIEWSVPGGERDTSCS